MWTIEDNATAPFYDILDFERCNCNALKAQGICSAPCPSLSTVLQLPIRIRCNSHLLQIYDYQIQEAICETGDRFPHY